MSFHLPPTAASAAVSGQPVTGFCRPLPRGAFLGSLTAVIIVRLMIVEVRTYRVTPGRRAEFIEVFEKRSVPLQRKYGMAVLGPFLDTENPNRFVWLRGFPSLEERDRMKAAFYGGDEFKNELEGILMPMLESYDVTLCESADLFG